MPDITMCFGGDCPIKWACHRYTVEPSEYKQSYFANPPFKDSTCDYFWGESSENILNMLKNIVEGKNNNMLENRRRRIIQIVKEEFSAPEDYHTSKNRKRHYVYPRKALCMLMIKYASFTYLSLSHYFGKKEHTTVRHAFTDGHLLLTQDEGFRMSYEKAEERIKKMKDD